MSSTQAVALYVDMLGFSALTRAHPDDFIETRHGGSVFGSNTPSASMFSKFNNILEQTIGPYEPNHPERAMIFSDGAFLIFQTAPEAAVFSTELMRRFVVGQVPVRMGLAFGTCHATRFTFDQIGTFTVTRAMFSGTAIVNASEAEKGPAQKSPEVEKSHKGCRIFVHPSLDDQKAHIENAPVAVLQLSTPTDHAHSELCYLHKNRPAATRPTAAEDDWALFEAITAMRSGVSEEDRSKVDVQYSATLEAINRMRERMSRPRFEVAV